MKVTIEIDDVHATAKLDAIGPSVHQALLDALRPLVKEVREDARVRALAHTHSYGPDAGMYLVSIYGGVTEREKKVLGWVRSGSPLAHLLEYGATMKPHDIYPRNFDVLGFEGDVGKVWRKHVHSPGATLPPYPAIEPAFNAERDEIENAIRAVAESR